MLPTYPLEELEHAKQRGHVSPQGVAYSVDIAGKKTAAVRLLKEAHHSSDDISRSRKWVMQKWRLVEISTCLYENR